MDVRFISGSLSIHREDVNSYLPTEDIDSLVTLFKQCCHEQKTPSENNIALESLQKISKIDALNPLSNKQIDVLTKAIIKSFPHLEGIVKQQAVLFLTSKAHTASTLNYLSNKFEMSIPLSENDDQVHIVIHEKMVDLQKLSQCIGMLNQILPDKKIDIDYSSETPLDDGFLNLHGQEIKSLDLRSQRNSIDDEFIKKLSRFCTNLDALLIQSAIISSRGLEGLSSLAKLTMLNLSNCSALQNVDGLKGLASLSTLNLSYCRALQNIGGLKDLASLTTLNLSGCSALQNVGALKGLASLITLNLSINRALQNLDGLETLTSLTTLDLSNNRALQNLDGLEALTSLTTLKLLFCYALNEESRLRMLTNRFDVSIESGLAIFQSLELKDRKSAGKLLMEKLSNKVPLMNVPKIRKDLGEFHSFILGNAPKTVPFPFDQAMADLYEFRAANFQGILFLREINAIGEMSDTDSEGKPNQIKKEKLLWLADALFMMAMTLNNDQSQWLNERGLLFDIQSFGRPDLRPALLEAAVTVAASPPYGKTVEFISGGNLPWKKLSRMLLAKLYLEGVDEKELTHVMTQSETGKSLFYNGLNAQILIDMLLKLSASEKLTAPEKQMVLARISAEAIDSANTFALKRVEDAGNDAQEKFNAVVKEGKIPPEKLKAWLDPAEISEDLLALATTVKEKIPSKKLQAWREAIAAYENANNTGRAEPTATELESQYLKNMRIVLAIMQFDDAKMLIKSGPTLEERLEKAFKAKIPLGEVHDFSTRIFDTFGSSRQPMAIVTYTAKMNELGDKAVMDGLGDYVTAVLKGTFAETRYALDKNPHLGKIHQYSPELLTMWKVKIPSFELEIVSDSSQNKPFVGEMVADWMQTKLLVDGHLNLEELQLSFLKKYLESNDPEMRKAIITQCTEERKRAATNLRKESEIAKKVELSSMRFQELGLRLLKETQTEKQVSIVKNLTRLLQKESLPFVSQNLPESLGQKDFSAEEIERWMVQLFAAPDFQMGSLDLLKRGLIDRSEINVLLQELAANRKQIKESKGSASTEEQAGIKAHRLQEYCFQLIAAAGAEQQKPILAKMAALLKEPHFRTSNHPPAFCHDIEGLQEILQSTVRAKKLTVVDSDDPFDLLLSGTDVRSCQSVDGDPQLNKGLLGYLMDGKVRVLAVQDENGKTVARCLLRILLDGDKPVLFRDKFYAFNLTPQQKDALNQMAVAKAQALGIPVVSQDGSGKSYDRPLEALGGPSPWEYCDGADHRGLKAQGKYTISRSKFLA